MDVTRAWTAALSSPTARRKQAPCEFRAGGPEGEADAVLRVARASLDREKLRTVATFPFVGRQMLFESDTAVLQITSDGRFSYSTFPVGPTPAEVASGMRRHTARTVVAIEGVFSGKAASTRESGHHANTANSASSVPQVKDDRDKTAAAGGTNAPNAAAAMASDSASQTVEGIGVLRHESEECQGQTRLQRLEHGEFHLAISVSPFYNPTMAMVQPIGPGASAERAQVLNAVPIDVEQQPRAFPDPHKAALPRLRPLAPHGLQARRPRGALLRFSPSEFTPPCTPPGTPSKGAIRSPCQAAAAGVMKQTLYSSISAPCLTGAIKDATGWYLDHRRNQGKSGATFQSPVAQ